MNEGKENKTLIFAVVAIVVVVIATMVYGSIASREDDEVTTPGFDEVIVERRCDFLTLDGKTYQRCHDGTMWIARRMKEGVDPFQESPQGQQ